MSLFRYPGGKGKMRTQILSRIGVFYDINGFDFEFREPFFGAGAIGLTLLNEDRIDKVWINDFDPSIAAIWTSVIMYPEELCEKITQYIPSTQSFFSLKNELLKTGREIDDIVEMGFKKLAIHQISYSGLGTKAGGPLGGKGQGSIYDVGCRWTPDNLRKEVKEFHKLLSKKEIRYGKCTDFDFEEVISDKGSCFLYVDPPYYHKGPELYQYHFTLKDHNRLAGLLREVDCPWLLSYDDCPEIRRMYSWAEMIDFSMIYTINKAREKNELLIAPNKELLWDAVETDLFDEQYDG